MDWNCQNTPLRLLRGAHAFQTAAGSWILRTPDEEFARISLPPALDETFGAILGGTRAPSSAPIDGELSDVLDALLAEGLLQDAAAERAEVTSAGGRVLVTGGNPLARAIAGVLADSGVVVEALPAEPPDLAAIRAVDCVVATSGWLPDACWSELDERCASAGTPSHRAYVEGDRLFLGPLTIPGASPSYRDLRLRRIAASPWPEELQAHWQALDRGEGIGTVAWPAQPALVAAAAAVASDILGFLAGGEAPGTAGQIEFDPAMWQWRTHPVLPIPQGIMTVSP